MNKPDSHERPPLFKRWTHWYWLVIGFLGVLIVLFYWMTRHFSPGQ